MILNKTRMIIIDAKLSFFLLITAAIANSATAQTWQKQKQTTLPIVVANTLCDSVKDTIGITADRSMILTCQSGAWKAPGGAVSMAVKMGLDPNIWPDHIFCEKRLFIIAVNDASGVVFYSTIYNQISLDMVFKNTAGNVGQYFWSTSDICPNQSIQTMKAIGTAW